VTPTDPQPTRRRFRARNLILVGIVIVVLIGIWLHRSGSPRATYRVGSRAYAVAFSPDGSLLATGGALSNYPGSDANGVIRLWDLSSGLEVKSWTTKGYHVARLAFDRSGRTLTSTAQIESQGNPKCELRRWNLKTYKEIESPTIVEYPPAFPVTSQPGNAIAKHGGWGVLAICEGATGEGIYRVQGRVRERRHRSSLP
jgi:hypothetical protein